MVAEEIATDEVKSASPSIQPSAWRTSWPRRRRTGRPSELAYFEWARKVVDGVRGVHPQLEAVFDGLLARAGELQGESAQLADQRPR